MSPTQISKISGLKILRQEADTARDGCAGERTEHCPPQEIPVVELITATESAIRNNNLTEAEVEQFIMKVRTITFSLDQNITILSTDKRRCTVILDTTECQRKWPHMNLYRATHLAPAKR